MGPVMQQGARSPRPRVIGSENKVCDGVLESLDVNLFVAIKPEIRAPKLLGYD